MGAHDEGIADKVPLEEYKNIHCKDEKLYLDSILLKVSIRGLSISYYKLITHVIMKELKQIKLTQLSKAELSKREMNKVLGGGSDCCICNCYVDNSSLSIMSSNEVNGIEDGGGAGSGSYG